MSTPTRNFLATTVALRAGTSLTLAVSGLIHAELYVHGYRYVPTIGQAFLAQASVFVALAILIAVGGPRWLQWAASLGALGSLVAFALSRTVGIFGFVEHGWQPGMATAATTGPVDAATTIHDLQASGYRVILNKVGAEPLSACHVTSIRPGQPVTETVPAGGGDTVQKVVYTPVYVDVAP
ncbi:MAG: hypothetical protein QOG01_1838 [Pseudonocardiales bacterium]|jgi:hypothetical protein|nr:hypothetical protein [Pseudonocardiales bacterium]MDT5314994.1 hypothetical protein [Mycobacterium sp.]